MNFGYVTVNGVNSNEKWRISVCQKKKHFDEIFVSVVS